MTAAGDSDRFSLTGAPERSGRDGEATLLQGRQRFWAGRAIEKLVCTDGKMIDNYVTYRKARGEDKIIIAHWKGQKFYEDLSKDSGISLPKTWGSKLPMLCESCFADYVAAMRVHQRSLSNVY